MCARWGGRPQLPNLRNPCSSLTLLPGLLLHPTPPSPPESPSPLPAVKRCGERGFPLPPPAQPRTVRGSLSPPPPPLSGREILEESYSLRPAPLLLQLWLRGGQTGFESSFFGRSGSQSGRLTSPRGAEFRCFAGEGALRCGASAARRFARGGGKIERGRGGHVWEGEVGVVFGKLPTRQPIYKGPKSEGFMTVAFPFVK